MPSKKPKLDTFRKVANACGGILSDIAANLGVERSTIYTWCNDDEQFAQALEDSRERFVDFAESNLRNWLPAFRPSKRTRMAKRDLPVGSNVPPKQRSFSLSKHAEKNGDM